MGDLRNFRMADDEWESFTAKCKANGQSAAQTLRELCRSYIQGDSKPIAPTIPTAIEQRLAALEQRLAALEARSQPKPIASVKPPAITTDSKPDCPYCGASNPRSQGKRRNNQRWLCRECGKSWSTPILRQLA